MSHGIWSSALRPQSKTGSQGRKLHQHPALYSIPLPVARRQNNIPEQDGILLVFPQ